jgi:hypothetical protein
MDFLKFAITALLSSAVVSAVLFAIISLLTRRAQKTSIAIGIKTHEGGFEATDRARKVAVQSHSTRLS